MKKCTVTLLLSVFVFFAPTGVFAETETKRPLNETPLMSSDPKDMEILKLKLEIEKLKNELNNAQSSTNGMEPPTVCPPKMTEQEFIESHRTNQDKQGHETADGLEYPRSLILRYKKLMDEHQSERSYYYLYARLLPLNEAVELTNLMIEKWPDFAYGYRLRSHQLMYQNPPDCSAALEAAKKEVAIDSGSSNKQIISFLRNCVEATQNIPSVKLTFDVDAINGNYGVSTAVQELDKNVLNVKKKHIYDMRTTTISLNYVGMTQLRQQNVNIGPVFHYDISVKGDYGDIKLLLIPKDGRRIENTERWLFSNKFRAGHGVESLFFDVETMRSLKEIQLINLSYY